MKTLTQKNFETVMQGVLKPGRYIGGETGTKSIQISGTADISSRVFFALVFPDVYEVGMSNLGMQILYDVINSTGFSSAERVFSPWIDMEKNLRESGTRLFSLENRIFLNEFDIIGISAQHELQYTNILNIIDLSGLNLRADKRGKDDPIICCGGPSVVNPLPLAPFFDFFVIGDGEETVVEILKEYREVKNEDNKKMKFLERIEGLSGVFVPSKHKLISFSGSSADRKMPDKKTAKAVFRNFSSSKIVTDPVIPNIRPVHDRFVCEIMRGCSRGCRFCQAGYFYRPVRMKDPLAVAGESIEGIENTGYDEISFLSLSSADFKGLDILINKILSDKSEGKLSISLPSLRLDSFTLEIADLVQSGRKTGLTFAPEAGSQILRDIINKNLDAQGMIDCMKMAFLKGWEKIKLYFMIGLPFEKTEDIEAIADFVRDIIEAARETLGPGKFRRFNLNISVNAFIPKPFTAFQWEGQENPKELYKKFKLLKDLLPKKNISLSYSDTEKSLIEAAFSRGDERLSSVLEEAFLKGSKFDNWSEIFDFSIWQSASEKKNISFEQYASRKIELNEVLPWDFIDIGVKKDFLVSEYLKAEQTAKNR